MHPWTILMVIETDIKKYKMAMYWPLCATNMFATYNFLRNTHEIKVLTLSVSGGELTEVSSYLSPSLNKGLIKRSH